MSIRFEYTKRLQPEYTVEELRTVALLLEQSLERTINEGRVRGGSSEDPVRSLVREILVESLVARVPHNEPSRSLDEIIKAVLTERINEVVGDAAPSELKLLVESGRPLEVDARYQVIELLRNRLTEEENVLIRTLTERYRLAGTAPGAPLLELAGLTSNLWPKDQDVLLVYFFSSDTQLTAEVLNIANQWHEHCRIRFEATDDKGASDIRVSFEAGGSWSYIGTEAKAVRLVGQATMNFSWLTPNLPKDEFQQVVLHEFGHALGMVHEHQAGVPPIQWNKTYVLMWCALPPNNWTRADVQRNIFHRYQQSETNHSGGMDMDSIMIYRVPPEFTVDRIVFPANNALSKLDGEHIGRLYPKVDMLKS